MIEVVLTREEMIRAASVAIRRNCYDIKNRVREEHSTNLARTSWQGNCIGALGEYAVCKHYGLKWNPKTGNFRDLDCGGVYEVRTGGYPNSELVIYPEDYDNVPYVHVRGSLDRYQLLGWLYGYEGKKPENWKDRWNSGEEHYWIHPDRLNPMETLPTAEFMKRHLDVQGRNRVEVPF
jgi:hypothetical protein